MNILIAADYSAPSSGNFIASLVELGRELKNDNNIFFIFPESPNTLSEKSWVHWLENEGFKVFLAKDKSGEGAYCFLHNIIKENNIDILHVHFGMYHKVILDYANSLNVKIIVHDHMEFDPKVSVIKQKVYCAITSLKYKKNKINIVCVNERKCKAYIFTKGYYIPNGISFIRNVPYYETRAETRNRLNIKDDEKLCFFLGWHLHTKGMDIALKAVEALRKSDVNIVLGVVGHSANPSDNSLKAIEEFTGVDPRSSWIKYLESTDDIFAYHKAADVYLSASRSESFSYGVLEAISQNVPVVVSDIPGTAWSHSYNKSFIYPTEDFNECAKAIECALKLDENAPSNFNEIIESFSIKRWCSRIIEIYKIV